MSLKLNLHRRIKVMRVGVKASTSQPLSAEHQELPCLNKRGIILWSFKLWTITSHTRALWKAHTSRVQMSQLYMLPIGVHQFRWWESHENRNLLTRSPQPVSLPQTHTKHRAVVNRCQWCCMGWWHNLLQGKLPNSTIGWWSLVQRSNSR